MEFWNIIVFNKDKNLEENIIIQAPYNAQRIIEILAEVHPEYENIRASKAKKPAGMKAWKDDYIS